MKRRPTRTSALVLALILGTLALAACGGDDDSAAPTPESAEDALRRQFTYIGQGDWERDWDELHPAQQALVSKEQYVTCASLSAVEIESVRVIQSYKEEIDVPGTGMKAPSTALRAQVRYTRNGTPGTLTETIHQVKVNGRWAWVLRDVTVYDKGGCP